LKEIAYYIQTQAIYYPLDEKGNADIHSLEEETYLDMLPKEDFYEQGD